MQVTVLWYDKLKGIGEAFDSNGEIVFLNYYHQNFSKLFPDANDEMTITWNGKLPPLKKHYDDTPF